MNRVHSIVTAIVFVCLSNSASAGRDVIYGKDDRKDLYEVTNPMHLQLADSTVALVQSSDMSQSSGVVTIKASTLRERGICAKERFSEQPSGAFCSGSLIGKSTILTAGHCITDADDCASTKFVFGYGIKQKGQIPNQVQSSEVYSCKKIIHRVLEQTGKDFALIELDRPVVNHAALRMNMTRRTVDIELNTRLIMIGHPTGIPTKVEDGGKVRETDLATHFVATTDSYGGNSGSAVFNYESGEIEGVLVRGEDDYVSEGGCKVSNICTETGCMGEHVTKIAQVLPFARKIR